jgi:hypothetical protein
MRKGVLVLLALLIAGAAAAEDDAAPPLRLPAAETFRLFPQAAPDPRIDLSGRENQRLFHQAGDPDSQFTLGKPSPQGEVRVLAVFDVNEIFLKAIPPNPLVSASDTRPRSPGSFLPVDSQGRPYQLRLGARLVW